MNTGSIYGIRCKESGKLIYFGQSKAKDAVMT